MDKGAPIETSHNISYFQLEFKGLQKMVETYKGHFAQILAFFAYTLLSIKAGEIALQEVNLHDTRM